MDNFLDGNLVTMLHRGNIPLLVGSSDAIQQFTAKTELAKYATFALEDKYKVGNFDLFLKNNEGKYNLIILLDMDEDTVTEYSNMLSSKYYPHLLCQMDKAVSDSFSIPGCSIGRLIETSWGTYHLELHRPHTVSRRYARLVFDLSVTDDVAFNEKRFYPLSELFYFTNAYVLAKECGFNVQLRMSVTDNRGNTLHINGCVLLPNFSDSDTIHAAIGITTYSFQVKDDSTGEVTHHCISSNNIQHIAISLKLLDDVGAN